MEFCLFIQFGKGFIPSLGCYSLPFTQNKQKKDSNFQFKSNSGSKMSEDLKTIVLEINKLLKTDYNLISFDSLTPESILQLLVDVLNTFQAIQKVSAFRCVREVDCSRNPYFQFDVKENDPEKTNKEIIEALRRIQYRPSGEMKDDPSSYRRALLRGDKKVFYPIFQWIFVNCDKVKKAAYLAKYLMPLDMPPEALAIPEIATLWSQYQASMDDFKDAHKAHQLSVKEGAQTRELKNDVGAIETEIENVKKRIERTQARLDKVPQQELLLETANSLRIERERQKELQVQVDDQKQSLNKANLMYERMKKELYNARIASQGSTPEHLMETLLEETQVLEFMIQQKLPQELLARQTEVQILQDIMGEPNISREYLLDLQMKVDAVNSEVQQLVETRINERGTQSDNLAPFRQQAAMVARNKDTAAEQLDQAAKELHEIEQQMQLKSLKLRETVGDVILRGDELKQFVNTLKAKSNVYKQQRAELATVKAEALDLTQTLENLKTQDPSLQSTLETNDDESGTSMEQHLTSRPDSPIEQRGITELSRLVAGLVRAVNAARERITPLSQQLRPLRERITELKDERDIKKQVS